MLLLPHVAILMMNHRPLIAHLPPFVPYKKLDVAFQSVHSLAPGEMLDTGILDFCVQ